jgi:hypothetical protein
MHLLVGEDRDRQFLRHSVESIQLLDQMKGAITRRLGSGGGSFVVVDEAPESVEPLDSAGASRSGGSGGRSSSERCAFLVVVGDVLADDVGRGGARFGSGSSRGTRGGSCGRTARRRRLRPAFGLASGACGSLRLRRLCRGRDYSPCGHGSSPATGRVPPVCHFARPMHRSRFQKASFMNS